LICFEAFGGFYDQHHTSANAIHTFVDDELPVLKSLKRLALDESWSVFCANSAEEGLAVLQQQPVNVVVSDMRMPGMDGAEFLTRVRNEQPDTERILITGYADVHALEKVVNEAKIFNYISKPWDDQVLTRVIQGALDFQSAQKEQKRLEKLTAAQTKNSAASPSALTVR
jgi:Response regulator containing CheY-like receiver, AAA-type ATPase, and DNA-binding domains